MNIIKIIKTVAPKFHDIHNDIVALKHRNPAIPAPALSKLYINKIRNKYASVGVASALPGIIPGAGSITQAVVEAGTMSTDVALMLRWMGVICYGTAIIYKREIENDFETQFTIVLGIWLGVIVHDKKDTHGTPLTLEHFNSHINDRIRSRMNQKVTQKLLIKYGAKRGGIVLGKLIPFGIGAVVSGTFNYNTMQRFGEVADNYFKTDNVDHYTILD
jgi:uncharacterized protein (DUF697 family)